MTFSDTKRRPSVDSGRKYSSINEQEGGQGGRETETSEEDNLDVDKASNLNFRF